METDGGDKTSLCKPQPTFQFLWQYFSPRCVCVCLFVAYRDLWEPRSSCSCAIDNGDLPHILSLRNHNLKSVYRALFETEIKPTHLAFTELNYRYETQPLPFPCNNPAPKHSNARARNARVRHSSQPGFARERPHVYPRNWQLFATVNISTVRASREQSSWRVMSMGLGRVRLARL